MMVCISMLDYNLNFAIIKLKCLINIQLKTHFRIMNGVKSPIYTNLSLF